MASRGLNLVQRPVALTTDDTATANLLINRLGRLAADIVPDAPGDGTQRDRLINAAKGVNQLIESGQTRRGLKVQHLADAANYSEKHLLEGLDGTYGRQWAATLIRLLSACAGPMRVEHLLSAPVEVRRESGAIGYDHPAGCSHLKPMLMLAGAGIDRFVCSWETPLTTATCWDHSDPRADPAKILTAQSQLGHALPGTWAEHLTMLMADRAALLDFLVKASKEDAGLFDEAKLDVARIVANCSSRYCVLEAMAYGRPIGRGLHFGEHLYPGDHPDLMELVSPQMRGIAECVEQASVAAVIRAGEPQPLQASLAAALGLPISPLDSVVHAISSDLLLHTAANPSGANTTWWRVFGMDGRDPMAVALVEHAGARRWRKKCLARAYEHTAPGLLYPKRADHRLTLRALLRAVDAARVAAERLRHARG
jgi:hypothetical protein